MHEMDVNISLSPLCRDILIDRKSRSLLKYSETSKNYPLIYQFASDCLLSDSKEIDLFINRLKSSDISFLNDMLVNLVVTCKNEWIGEEKPYDIIEDEKKRLRCKLCGRKDTKLIYYISNRLNKNRINVGSTCIGLFEDIYRKDVHREANRLLRLSNLTAELPGIERIINNWENHLNTYDVLIPLWLENPYLELGVKLKELYESFLSQRIGNSVIDEMRNIIDHRDTYIKDMDKYTLQHREEIWITTRSIINWLKRNNRQKILDLMKVDGFITFEAAQHIEEETFLNFMMHQFNNHLRLIGAQITGIDVDNRSFIIKPSEDQEVYLESNFSRFIKNFGWFLFSTKENVKGPQMTLYNIIKTSNVYNAQSIELILQSMIIVFARSVISIYTPDYENSEMIDYDPHDFNELDLIDKRNGQIIVVNLKDFLDDFKIIAFDVNRFNETDLIKYVDQNLRGAKRYTIKELIDLRSTKASFNKKEN